MTVPFRNTAPETTRRLYLLISLFGLTSLGSVGAEQKRDQDLAWAASVASAHEEVAEMLERRQPDRMTIQFAERWSVWVVKFFDGDDSLITVSVNHEGEIVEIERQNDREENASEEQPNLQRQRLLHELEFARSTNNQVEEQEILELLERLEWEAEDTASKPKKRNVAHQPADSTLPFYVLSLPEEGIHRMKRSVTEDIKVRGELRFENWEYPIEIRLRGASTRHATKKSYRVRFLEQTPLPRKVTYLKAEPMDYSMQQEKLSCDLFKAAGLPVSECRYVNLFINGSYEGVYLNIEPIRSPFKENDGLSPEGTLIRARTFQHENHHGPIGDLRGDVGSLEELHQFIQRLNRVGRDELESFVRSETDWPRVRDYLAMQVICHRSEIEADDYFFYRDPVTRKWSLIPRDHNNGNFAVVPHRNRIAEPSISIFPQTIQDIGWRPEHWFVLPSRVFNNATLRTDYLNRLEAFVHQYLLSNLVTERINANFRELKPEFPQDPYRKAWARQDDPFLGSATELKRFSRIHGKRLLHLIERERNRPEPVLTINAARQQKDHVELELHNKGSSPIRLDECFLAAKDSQGKNRSMPLHGQIGPGDLRVVRINRNQKERLDSFNFDGGVLILTRSANSHDGEESRREQILDFLYLNRLETSKADRP